MLLVQRLELRCTSDDTPSGQSHDALAAFTRILEANSSQQLRAAATTEPHVGATPMTSHEGVSTNRPAGPIVTPAKCPCCGRMVDPLRAGHVAMFGDRFHYFCNRLCRDQHVAQHPDIALSTAPADSPSPHNRLGHNPHHRTIHQAEPAVDPDDPPLDPDSLLPNVDEFVAFDPQAARHRSDTGTVLLASATVAGVLAIALALTGTGAVVLTVRLAVTCVGAVLLLVRSGLVPPAAGDPHRIAILAPAVAAAAFAIWARVVGHEIADESTVLTGLIVVSTATSMQLVEQARRTTSAWLVSVQQALDVPTRRIVPAGYSIVGPNAIRPGEEILIDAGETVPADVVISAGDATVLPWFGARTALRKRHGDSLVAGSRVVTGRLRTTATWTGSDRAWLCSTVDPHRAAHVMTSVARHARQIVERWALGGGVLAGLAALVNGMPTPHVILAAIAGHAAVASVATGTTPALHVLRGIVAALDRGIAYRHATAWEAAAHATVAVFSARGTLLLGEPQVAEIVGLGRVDATRVLALACGAEQVASDAIAAAVLRAARLRGVVPDAVRSPSIVTGQGVTAVTSNGETLCVGSRALMMREHISMATMEGRLAELETMGRTVLLVSVGGRIIGFIALQDGLRPGARAAVQYLLDGGVEPVLMSGDARETCDAVARSLEIEHVRPEVMPADRAQEVRSIAESGATVAVVGRPHQDETALDAANVAVALDAAGSSSGDWAVTLASDDVRDAAEALVSARRARAHARTALLVGLAPSTVSALAIAFGLLPPAYAPLAVLIGAVGTHLHLRAVEPSHDDGTMS